jgi:ankyrin repeat protein
MLAADFGETKVLKLLLQVQDILVSLRDFRSYTALDYAAQNIQTPESCEVLKDLIRAMKQSKGRAGPALVIAAKHDNIDVVSLLLSEMPEQMREYLGSSLCVAASERQYETIRLLLTAGAPVNRLNLNETAPLYLALMAYDPSSVNSCKTVEALLGAGAECTINNWRFGAKPFEGAVQCSPSDGMVQLLISWGFPVDGK